VKRYNLSSSFLGVVLSAKIAFSKRSLPYLVACAVPSLTSEEFLAMCREVVRWCDSTPETDKGGEREG